MHIAMMSALKFDKLISINIGQHLQDAPYWAIQNAIGFAATANGELLLLAPEGPDSWYSRYSYPHHVVRKFGPMDGPSFTFGEGRKALQVFRDPEGDGWYVVGEPGAFNPHLWEPSVLPASH